MGTGFFGAKKPTCLRVAKISTLVELAKATVRDRTFFLVSFQPARNKVKITNPGIFFFFDAIVNSLFWENPQNDTPKK